MGRQAVRDGGRVAFHGHSAHSRPRVRAVPLLGMKGMKIVAGTGIDSARTLGQFSPSGKVPQGARASSGCRHGLLGHGLLAQTMDSVAFTPVHSQILNAAFARIEPSLFNLRSPPRTAPHLRSIPPSFLHSTPFSRNSSVPMS